MARTLFEKIWEDHLVGTRPDGRELLYIDRHVLHELHAPHAFKELSRQQRVVRRRDLTRVVQDHTVSTRSASDPLSENMLASQQACRVHQVRCNVRADMRGGDA